MIITIVLVITINTWKMKNRQAFKRITTIGIFCILYSTLFSCASFSKQALVSPIKQGNPDRLNGTYAIIAQQDSDENSSDGAYFNVIEKLDRKYAKNLRDSVVRYGTDSYFVRLNILNDKQTRIDFMKNETVRRTLSVKSKLKKDGFLYIKNRHLRWKGLPYVFGFLDKKRIRIGVDVNEDLIVDESHHSSLGFLILFNKIRTKRTTSTYKKIKAPTR